MNLNGSFLKNVTTPLGELGLGVHRRDSRNSPWGSAPTAGLCLLRWGGGRAHTASHVFFILSEKFGRKDTSSRQAPTQHFSVISAFNSLSILVSS